MSTTAAYNANEVAAVYMSFNRDDLLSSDEGGNLSDETLKNGFYGLSDPMNLRGVLERFECDFNYGGNTSHYRIRILNPTAELEMLLFGFYNSVFPESLSTFEVFSGTMEKDKRMNSVEEATGDRDTAFLANNQVPPLPRVYIRWGYGTAQEEGLSRIHKAILSDMSYEVKDNADKVIELKLADTFTYNKQNNSFNQRDAEARIAILEEDKSLKKPSDILTELFGKYMQQFPECIPLIDLGAYASKLDDLTFALAAAIAEADKLSQLTATPSEDVSPQKVDDLDEKTRKEIEGLLDRPITSDVSVDRKAEGTITQSILYQAYKQIFEQIGFKWQPGDSMDPPPVESAPASNQLSQKAAAMDSPINADATSEERAAKLKEMEDTEVDLYTDVLANPTGARAPVGDLTKLGQLGENTMLSFWPMVMEFAPQADPVESEWQWGTITNIDVSGVLRVPTWEGVPDVPCVSTHTPGSTSIPCDMVGVADPGAPTRTYKDVSGLVVTVAVDKLITKPISVFEYQCAAPGDANGTIPSMTCVGGPGTSECGTTRLNSYNPLTFTSDPFGLHYQETWMGNTGAARPQVPGDGEAGVAEDFGIQAVEIVNVQGTINLNEEQYYLWAPDPDANLPGGGQEGQYFLVRPEDWNAADFQLHEPTPVGYNWEYNNNPGWTQWEQGGILLDPGRELPQDQPEGAKVLRTMTVREKTIAMGNGWAPLWLPGGAVNSSKAKQGEASPDKFRFNLRELDSLTPAYTYIKPSKLWRTHTSTSSTRPGGNLPKLKVSMPAMTDQFDGVVGMGAAGTGGAGTYSVRKAHPLDANPILDLQTGKTVFAYESSSIPKGEYQNWLAWKYNLQLNQYTMDDHEEFIKSENPPVIELEPTLDTWRYLMFAARYMMNEKEAAEALELEKQSEQEKEDAEAVKAASGTPQEPPKPGKIPQKPITNALVVMGTDGMMPHISAFLQDTVNAINKLVVGQTEKLDVMPVQISKLSPEDRIALSEKAYLLYGQPWNETWATNNYTMLVLGPSDVFREQYSAPLIRPVMSFPQLTSEEYGAPYMFLDYGTGDSIVAKLDFDGGTRVLTNMMNSTYAVRQWHDVKSLFDGTNTLSKNLMVKVIAKGLQNKIDALLQKGIADDLDSQKKLEELMAFQQRTSDDLENKSESGEISGDILDLFPEMVKSFETDSELQEVIGSNTAKDVRLLASLVSNPKTMNMLFPQAEVDGGTNEVSNQSLMLIKGELVKVEEKTKILNRKVDFSNLHTRLGGPQAMRKMSDFAFSYINAMQNESFELKVTTLGLPELDDPMTEFLSRVVVLNFKDARFASGANHWMSGVYRIKGIKHIVEPGSGFLTQLNLFKVTSNGNINKMKDTR